MMNASMDRALKLAAVTGLRAALGPALLAEARRRPERQNLALAALCEMVFDKLPLVPGRDTLPSLVVRGAAGAWVASQVVEAESGEPDPWAAPLGAAVALGVAVAAPKLRRALGWTTGMPQMILGLAEDYLALRLGTEALGMSMDEVTGAAWESVDDLRERLHIEAPEMPWLGSGSGPSSARSSSQSAGAGSM
jgi:hypothetical protein